jgi:LacI family transcriptional regulator
VLPDLHGEFFSEIVRGMDREASRRGYLLLLSNLHAGGEQAASALRAMRGRVDGLIVMAPHLQRDELSSALPAGLPCMLINARDESGMCSSITLDNAAGVEAVVDHLVSLGCKRLIHIAGPNGNRDAEERSVAFSAAVKNRRIDSEIVSGDFQEESGVEAVTELLRAGRHFDGIFAANDNMAIGAIEALRAARLNVPGDVAVAGFDDIPLARHLGLTTVSVRIAELGEVAIASLLDRVAKVDGKRELLHRPELVVRATTDPKV